MKNKIISTPLTMAALLILVLVGTYLVLVIKQSNKASESNITNITNQTSSDMGYQETSITQLVTNMSKYNGKKVLVSGKYQKHIISIPLCEPVDNNQASKVLDEYVTYRSQWVISNEKNELGVEILDNNGVGLNTLPNYTTNQTVQLKGIARTTTVQSYCTTNISNRTIYLEVQSKDLDITQKDSPTTTPSDSSDETAKDQKWISIEPIQCLGNPWEKDWLAKNGNNYSSYPKNNEKQIIQNFIKEHGYEVYSIQIEVDKRTVCAACDCPRGDKMKLLINRVDESSIIDLLTP